MIGFDGVSQRQEIACPVAEGAVFLCDPTRSEGLKALPDEPVVATPSCISFRTHPAGKGAVTLVFADDEQDYDGARIFGGKVQTAGGKLAFTNSTGGVLVQIAVTSPETQVRVLANHKREPSKLVCIVEDPSSSRIDWAEELLGWLHRFLRH